MWTNPKERKNVQNGGLRWRRLHDHRRRRARVPHRWWIVRGREGQLLRTCLSFCGWTELGVAGGKHLHEEVLFGIWHDPLWWEKFRLHLNRHCSTGLNSRVRVDAIQLLQSTLSTRKRGSWWVEDHTAVRQSIFSRAQRRSDASATTAEENSAIAARLGSYNEWQEIRFQRLQFQCWFSYRVQTAPKRRNSANPTWRYTASSKTLERK